MEKKTSFFKVTIFGCSLLSAMLIFSGGFYYAVELD